MRFKDWITHIAYFIRGYSVNVALAVYLLYKSLLNQVAIPARTGWANRGEEDGVILWELMVFVLIKGKDDTTRSRT